MRMIVFPLRRSVALRAATASSGAIGLDDEVDCQAVGGPRLGRPYDGHQGSSGPDQACGPLLDVSADDVEDQIDVADVF
jgi:hypothetical protein